MHLTTPTHAILAERYRVSTKSIQRMVAAGVDVADPAAVAIHLANQRSAHIPALERVHALLEDLGPVARLES